MSATWRPKGGQCHCPPCRHTGAHNCLQLGRNVQTILLSVPWTWNFGEPAGSIRECTFKLIGRSSEWRASRFQARLRMITDAFTLGRLAKDFKTVVLSTVGAEAGLTAALIKLRSRSTRVIVFDFLAPKAEFPHWMARAMLGFIDRFLVIRSGDCAMLGRRFGVPAQRCSFLRWPVRADQIPTTTSEAGYVYAAGWAHRDWPTLVEALDQSKLPAKIAPGREVDVPADSRHRIEVLDMPSPDQGRQLAAHASVIAVVMVDTDLPSGPLVLLDAMAAGKAVVATAVNGTRDYVRAEQTALVVPPGNPASLSAALTRLASDPELRARLGAAARTETLDRCSLERFWEGLADQCQ